MKVKEAIRLHYRQKSGGVIVLEFPPTCRHIFCGKWYCLSLPYQYMMLGYLRVPNLPFCPIVMGRRSFRLAWRRKPLEKITDMMGQCGLPMVSGFNEFCHGDFLNFPHFTMNSWLNYVVRWFWASNFPGSYGMCGMSLDQWQDWSKEDPAHIMNVGWSETTPLLSILKHYMQYDKLSEKKKLYSYRGPKNESHRSYSSPPQE